MKCLENVTFYEKWYHHPSLRNALISGLVTGTAFSLGYVGLISRAIEISLYIFAMVLGGYRWSREGILELICEKEIGIDILMMVAAFGSAILGMWGEAAFLVFLYGTGEGLEQYTYAKTRHSIRELLDLAPKEARLLLNGRQVVIEAKELQVGDIFIVRPGESVPTDGTIIKGRSSLDEAPVTGESIPVEKKEGAPLYAGTMNREGSLEVEATASFEDNTLSRIIHLVEDAQDRKGKSQIFIERFGKRYTPVVLLSALLMIVIPALFGGSISFWARRAVVLLVAAAPCALVMSTPVAIASGLGKAGRTGILVKGGVHLENLGKVRAVCFDKTGTLTSGEPEVTDVVAINGDESEILCMAYCVERFSEHPLAKAIVDKAEGVGVESFDASDFSAIAGYGATAAIGGRTIYVGKQGLFTRFGLESHAIPEIEKFRKEGKTVFLIGTEESVDGVIAIRDRLRPEAKDVVESLHSMGLEVVMLSGDSYVTAKAIADELGIDEVRADLKPEDKIHSVEELEGKYGNVVMVGDGINDAPALARASVGMAMGTVGTDAAIEAADIALMGDDLKNIPHAIELGKRARRISIQNIAFSLITLAVLVPSAVTGLMGVAMTVFLHEASEILAVANGLRVGTSSKRYPGK